MSKNPYSTWRHTQTSAMFFMGLFCLSMVCPTATGQDLTDKDRKKIEAIVQATIKNENLAGVAVCVVRNGKPEFCQAFGFADMKTKRPLTTDTPFQLASLSKQFAATSVILLVNDGKLTLEDPLSKHLNDLPNEWKQITVKQLLAHTSGIKNYTEYPNFRVDYQKDLSHAEMLAKVYSYPLDFEPGSAFSYSNSGYWMVGHLIEQVSGVGYGEFLKERIFDPLAMSSACLEPIQNSDPLRAIGHDYRAKKFRPATYNSPSWAYAAGGIVASINDLVKWDAAIDSHTLLSAEQQEILWAPQEVGNRKTEFGLGWMLRPAPEGKRFVLHLGNKPGFSASIARLVEDRLAIAVLSNRTHGDSSKILDEIGKLLLSADKD